MKKLLLLAAGCALFAAACLDDNPNYAKSGGPDIGKKKWDGPYIYDSFPPGFDGPPPPPKDGPPPPPHDGPPPPPPDGPPPPLDYGPTTNGTCAKAKKLTWSGTKVTAHGITSTSPNEYGTGVNCGDYATVMAARQVYYSLSLTAGETYRFVLKPTYNFARLDLFQACGVGQINTDCSSAGKTGHVTVNVNAGQDGIILFKPPKSGTWIAAVDGTRVNDHGPFTFSVEKFKGVTNDRCAKAKKLSFVGGEATVNGHTSGAANEHQSAITCGHSSYKYVGGQLYYKVSMTAGKTYTFTLKPTFYATLYLFRSSNCTAAGINGDCSSGGKTGAFDYYVAPNQSDTLIFTPSTSGDYTIAVDSRYVSYAGSFTLEVKEYGVKTNSTCAKATAVILKSGVTTTILGDTTNLTNEFGTQIYCGNYSTILSGNQAYFKFTLTGGKQYSFTLKPSFTSARFYIFGSACLPSDINKHCSSSGKTGLISSSISAGYSGTFNWTPPKTATYQLAVDSTVATSKGFFTLEIK